MECRQWYKNSAQSKKSYTVKWRSVISIIHTSSGVWGHCTLMKQSENTEKKRNQEPWENRLCSNTSCDVVIIFIPIRQSRRRCSIINSNHCTSLSPMIIICVAMKSYHLRIIKTSTNGAKKINAQAQWKQKKNFD